MMRIESNLCHKSDTKTIVSVKGWIDQEYIGSALGEGETVEIAEDNAISRLELRLKSYGSSTKTSELKKIDLTGDNNKIFKSEQSNKEKESQVKTPSDWSNELSAIDLEIKRLCWTREVENNYLKQHFGYNNRNSITSYTDINNYLDKLRKIEKANVDININELSKTLIKESDKLLYELGWDHRQGRDYLLKEFNVNSRKELDKIQLEIFVSKLKNLLNLSITK